MSDTGGTTHFALIRQIPPPALSHTGRPKEAVYTRGEHFFDVSHTQHTTTAVSVSASPPPSLPPPTIAPSEAPPPSPLAREVVAVVGMGVEIEGAVAAGESLARTSDCSVRSVAAHTAADVSSTSGSKVSSSDCGKWSPTQHGESTGAERRATAAITPTVRSADRMTGGDDDATAVSSTPPITCIAYRRNQQVRGVRSPCFVMTVLIKHRPFTRERKAVGNSRKE